jgi:hypothetical protein
MARTSIQERYIETARRVGSLADDLLGVKLGDVDGMRLESVRELLVGYGGLAGQEAWNLCQVGHLPKGYVDSYEQLLASMAPGVDAWLRAYVVAKARSVEA